ncbi:MAG: F0F1 ATP synthase subunit A [Nitrospirae bacterium]|nr:F0F1 ATP synthase subunit A [Nitrospirota bacterium]
MKEPFEFFHYIHGIPLYVTHAWLVMGGLIMAALAVRGAMAVLPGGFQNVVESVLDIFYDLVNESMGHEGRKVFPLIASLGLFILFGNFLGLVPGFGAPTGNINTTLALALPVFFLTHILGLKHHGLGYIKHFTGPMPALAPLMLPIELIGHVARPVTLAVRLFGNMTAKHYLLAILGVLSPWIIPSAILALGTLVSVIQAYVFVLLTTNYLAGAVEHAH